MKPLNSNGKYSKALIWNARTLFQMGYHKTAALLLRSKGWSLEGACWILLRKGVRES